MTKDTSGSAFPKAESVEEFGNGVTKRVPVEFIGCLTVRQWYAGMALQGLLANNEETPPFQTHEEIADYFARSAFKYADAMIAQGAKE